MSKAILTLCCFLCINITYGQVKTGSGGGHDSQKYGEDIEAFGEKKTPEQITILLKRKDFKNVGLSSGEHSVFLVTTIPKLLNEIKSEFNKTWGKCHKKKASNKAKMFDLMTSHLLQEKMASVELSTKISEFKTICKQEADSTLIAKKSECQYSEDLTAYIDFLLLFASKNLMHHLQSVEKQSEEEAQEVLKALKIFSELNSEKVHEK